MNKTIRSRSGRDISLRRQQVLKLYKCLKRKAKKVPLYNNKNAHIYVNVGIHTIIALATILRKRRSDWQDVINLLH